MQKHEILPHTADLRLKVEADSLPNLFAESLIGLSEILKPGFCQLTKELAAKKGIRLSSPNPTYLLIDFLSAVLTFSYQHEVIFCQAKFQTLTENSLQAEIFGSKVDGFDEDIKAVTYHEANVQRNQIGNLETVIVFDI